MTMKEQKNNKVILGLSGGVDSTTAALLLKEKGYEVIGLFLDVLGDNDKGIEEAREAADQLGIKFIHRDVSARFEDIVIKDFCSEYIKGRTPNPCVVCNPNVKFRTIIDVANEEGAYYIATGHYARIIQYDGIFYVQQAASQRKDQSYMLYHLGQDILSRLIFPLGDFEDKEETRRVAKSHSLANADKADSQEICFIDDGKKAYVDFIEKRMDNRADAGDFVDENGNVIGRHKGLLYYTIGQRKGLGLTLGKPAFVTHLDPENNRVTLGKNEDLFKKNILSASNFFVADGGHSIPDDMEGRRLLGKIRYASKLSPCQISVTGEDQITAVFDQAQRAATPGQSIVFYVDDPETGAPFVIGGGLIEGDY